MLNTSLMDTASEFNGDRILVWTPKDRSSEYRSVEIYKNPLSGALRTVSVLSAVVHTMDFGKIPKIRTRQSGR